MRGKVGGSQRGQRGGQATDNPKEASEKGGAAGFLRALFEGGGRQRKRLCPLTLYFVARLLLLEVVLFALLPSPASD